MKTRLLLLASCLAAANVAADIQATTPDGRKVLLKDNGLWEFVQSADDEAPGKASLVLEKREDIAPNGCRLGLRIHNNLSAQIRTLVLRFTAYKQGDIPFETVSRGYAFIKPTQDQYQEIRFRGVSCEGIDKVQVRAAHNCHIGDLTKYSATEDACLALLQTEPSELMTIYQAPPSDGRK